MPELTEEEFQKQYGSAAQHPAETITEDEFQKRYAPKKLEAPAATAPVAPVKPPEKTMGESFKSALTGAKTLLEPVRRTVLTSGAQMAGEKIAGAAAAPVAAVSGPGAPAVEAGAMVAGGAAGYDIGHIASNLLEGKSWDENLGEATKTGAATSTMAGIMGGIMKYAAPRLGNPEKAFTKIYGAIKDATKDKFDKLKELDFFSQHEKDHIMDLVKTGKLSLLGKDLNEKVTYEKLISRGVPSEGHFEASQLAGESIKPKKLMEALDKAEARLDESTSPEGSEAAKEAIHNFRKKIEESKGVLSPNNVRGMFDDLKDYLSKSKPKEGVPGNSKFQVFSGMDRALDQDIDASGAKILSMGKKLYHREKSLDSIFNEGFESGKPIAGETGLRAFDSKKFLDAIDDPMVSGALDAGEKKELKVLGTKLKGFELPTSGDFATIRTAEAALSRHMAMGAAMGIAGGIGGGYAGGKKGAGEGAALGLLAATGVFAGAKIISRTSMTGSIIKKAYMLPEGKEIVDRELKTNAGKISAKTTLMLANLYLQNQQKLAQERQKEGSKFKRKQSQDIIDQTKKEVAEMHQPAPQAPPTQPGPPQGQPGPQGMQGMIGQ
jgi:hypothetical protein